MAISSRIGRAIAPLELLPYLRSVATRVKLPWIVQTNTNEQASAKTCSPPHHVKIGLLVSGGPDSMAMAYLLKNASAIDDCCIEPIAFIVDHKARDGSGDEAHKVQHYLERLSIRSIVIDMQWPAGVQPLKLARFELEARVNRYQLVAKSALQQGIRHLFLGHHQDDQIETVMMRLLRQENHSLFGLRGISTESTIPCCDDIFGAHESQDQSYKSLHVSPISEHSGLRCRRSRAGPLVNPIEVSVPESIRLHRPLLNFSKADLVATCVMNNVSYVTDHTNFDPKTNTRNAVRYMRSHSALPKALSAKRILALQNRAENMVAQVLDSGTEYLNSFVVRYLNLAVGVIEIDDPNVTSPGCLSTQGGSNAISRLIELVSPHPRSTVPLQVPHNTVEALSLEASLQTLAKTELSIPKSTTYGRTTFRGVSLEPHHGKHRSWHLSRQPMRAAEVAQNTWRFGASEKADDLGKEYGHWYLWDSRFWIKLSASSTSVTAIEEFLIRPFRPSDSQVLKKCDNHNPDSAVITKLDRLLSRVAPGKVRWTLPIIVYRNTIIGFPTLNVMFPATLDRFNLDVECEIRYKSIQDLKHLNLDIFETGYVSNNHGLI